MTKDFIEIVKIEKFLDGQTDLHTALGTVLLPKN